MTDQEYELWRDQARYVRLNWRRSNTEDPCVDCLVAFSEAMRAEGRCNGTPGEARSYEEPVVKITDRRRESNRLAAQRWRMRQRLDQRATGTLG